MELAGKMAYKAAGITDPANEIDVAEIFEHFAHEELILSEALGLAEEGKGKDLIGELETQGVAIQARGKNTVAEEMSYAYKDVSDVVDIIHYAGISSKVAKIKPIGVIKG